MTEFLRGSEWRKWDLQVHTPASALNNRFGSDWDLYVKSLFNKAIKDEITVIGITDYYCIDGYKKIVTDYISDDDKLSSLFSDEIARDANYINKVKSIKLLPNIEFRFKDIITRNGNDCKIEGHIIFSDEVSINDIENKFLAKINFLDTITPNNTDKTPLIRASIESFGQQMKATQPTFMDSDYVVGLKCLVVDFEEVIDVLETKQANTFSGKYIFVIPEDDITSINWNSGAHQVRKKYYAKSNGIFSVNSNTIKWGLQETTKEEFGTLKPCFSCSDAHSLEDLFSFKSNIPCWIKSDATFAGLLQVFYQPTERIFLGDIPPKLQMVSSQPYYYLDSISIKKNDDAKNSTIWFDAEIPLSSGLVAIIGNKGSGKSALADIIGYLVNSTNTGKASFLSKTRFLKEDKKFAKDYHGVLTWREGEPLEKATLGEEITDVQRAEYLPQKHIDDICNDLENEIFQTEINKVIFSYIDTAERLETSSLADLLSKKTASIDVEIMQHRHILETVISEFISLIEQKTQKHSKEIRDTLNKKKGDLISHDKNKPTEVLKPTVDTESAKILEGLNKALVEVDEKIRIGRTELSAINIRISDLEQFLAKYELQAKQVSELNDAAVELAAKNNFTVDIAITLAGNVDVFRNELAGLKTQKIVLQNKLDSHDELVADETHELLLVEKRNIEEQIRSNTLAAEDGLRKYQEYISDVKIWQENRDKIEGNPEIEGTIKFCEAELSFIENTLPTKETEVRGKIFEEIKAIYDLLSQKIKVNKELYAPIEEKLSKILKDNTDRINFETILSISSDFGNKFLQAIKLNVDSEYKGITEGTSAIEKRIRECDFSNWTSFGGFVNGLIDSLFSDADKVDKLVKDVKECLEYITKLDYIKVQFSLKMDDKSLSELSPGQRGNVLLVFYLALNKKSEPLIIDQPEDNLDNQSVYNKLVPCILEAKKNRQVIIVTHNPNIAVACDAEQIICANIEKSTNKITYNSGSIENPEIREKVIDVLEGTMPAFNLRRIKYAGEVRQ